MSKTILRSIGFAQREQHDIPLHERHHNLLLLGVMVRGFVQHGARQSAIQKREFSSGDHLGLGNVVFVGTYQRIGEGVCRQQYHFYRETAFREELTTGATCGSVPVGSVFTNTINLPLIVNL